MEMERAANPFMEKSLKMKTLSLNTPKKDCSVWQMLVLARTEASSLSRAKILRIWMER